MLQKDDLLLVDQGYFKLQTLFEIDEKGAFFLTRFLVRTVVKDALTQAPIDLAKHLSEWDANACEMDVLMGCEKVPHVACRQKYPQMTSHQMRYMDLLKSYIAKQ